MRLAKYILNQESISLPVLLLFSAQLVFISVVTAPIIGVELPRFRLLVVTLFLNIVPGLVFIWFIGFETDNLLNLILYAIGLSWIYVMALGLLVSLFAPFVGITPFKPFVLLFIIVTPLLCLSILVNWSWLTVDLAWMYQINLRTLTTPSSLFLFSIPLFSIIAVNILNIYGDNHPIFASLPLLLLMCFIALIPLIGVSQDKPNWWYPHALWCMALAVLYHRSLWKEAYPFEMWMPEVAVQAGRWVPLLGTGVGHEGLLPYSILYPVASILADISPLIQLQVINPLFISLLPVASYQLFQRYVCPKDAFLGATILIFNHQFFFQTWPYGTRDAIATVFLVLFLLSLFDDELDGRKRAVLSLVFLMGVGVSHYGTAFILLLVLGSSFASIVLGTKFLRKYSFSGPFVIRLSLFLFAVVFIISWHTLTSTGSKGSLLLEGILRTFETPGFSGASAQSAQLESPPSITASKILYLLLTGFIGLGLLRTVVYRIKTGSSRFDDEYLILSSWFLATLVGSFLPIGSFFGTGRVIMISYSGTAVFSVVFIRKLLEQTLKDEVTILGRVIPQTRFLTSSTLFAIILAVLLLVNIGVVAFIVPNDYATNQVITDKKLQTSENPEVQWSTTWCFECDAKALAWLVDYRNPTYPVYSDGSPESIHWYGISVVQYSSTSPDRILDENSMLERANERDLMALEDSPPPTNAYIRIHSQNRQTGHLLQDRWSRQLIPLNRVQSQLDHSNKIYSIGESEIYLYQTSDTSTSPLKEESPDSRSKDPLPLWARFLIVILLTVLALTYIYDHSNRERERL